MSVDTHVREKKNKINPLNIRQDYLQPMTVVVIVFLGHDTCSVPQFSICKPGSKQYFMKQQKH